MVPGGLCVSCLIVFEFEGGGAGQVTRVFVQRPVVKTGMVLSPSTSFILQCSKLSLSLTVKRTMKSLGPTISWWA